jgi:mannan endo-1,4-beta-mannosidase
MRTWGFNDVTSIPSEGTIWFQLLNANGTGTINTGADGLERLDYVVQSAEAHDVKLIINFVNNWDNYGGIPAYASTFNVAQTDWFNSSVTQNVYLNYVSTLVNRYKSSTAIFAWELANEPRCQGCEVSTITDWVISTSAYIKSIDPNHMVTVGEGRRRHDGWIVKHGLY